MPTVGIQILGSTSSWTDTGLLVHSGDSLQVLCAGAIMFRQTTPGSPLLWALPEGKYGPEYSHIHGYQPDSVDDYQGNANTFMVSNTKPHCLALALVEDGEDAPSQPFAHGLRPGRHKEFTSAELAAVAQGSAPWRVWAIFNDGQGFFSDNTSGSFSLQLRVPEGLGHPNYPGWIFQWARAFDDEDRRRGGFCAETGFWAPAHCLVDSPVGRVIDYFAPEEA